MYLKKSNLNNTNETAKFYLLLRHKRHCMKLIFLLTITLFTNIVHAQGQSKTDSKPSSDIFKIITAPTSNQGKIEIHQNQQISDLVNRYIDSRKKDNTIPGYRILIYKSSGQTARAEANRTREKFISLFPDILA